MKFHIILKRAVLLLLVMTVLCGGIYTLMVTGLAQLIFPYQANGSIMEADGKAIGSELIGQYFTNPSYFWGRPSATTDYPYNSLASGGSNKQVTGQDTDERIRERMEYLHAADPQNTLPIPVELVTASASGLDPDISPNAAYYQASRIATLRKLGIEQIQDLIKKNTEDRFLGIFGEPRVNVLRLNLALDEISAK